MTGIHDHDPSKLIIAAGKGLQSIPEIKMPYWARFVKTGVSRERAPQQKDWWRIRAAAILRQVALDQQGVSTLRKTYSSRKNRGHKPSHRFPAGGKIIRVILQQLETAGFVKIVKGKGRTLTPAGQKFLSSAAKSIDKGAA